MFAFATLLLGASLTIGTAYGKSSDKDLDQASHELTYFVSKILEETNRPVIRQDVVVQLMKSGFDIPTINKFVLGRAARGQPKDILSRFNQAYQNLMIQIYASRLEELRGAGFKTLGAEPVGRRDVKVLTHNQIQGRDPLKIEFRMRKVRDTWKIIDMYVLNISMATAQRREVAALLNNRFNGDIDMLTNYLQLLTDTQVENSQNIERKSNF